MGANTLELQSNRFCLGRRAWAFASFLGLSVFTTGAVATELGVFSGYRTSDDFTDNATNQSITLEEGESVGVMVEIPYSEFTEMEFLYSSQSTRFSGSGTAADGLSVDVDYWHLGGTYLFPRPGMTPYFAATMGAGHLAPDGLSSETKFSFSIGGGAKIALGKRFGLRVDGRAFLTTVDSGGAMFCTNGQCRVIAGGTFFSQMEASAGVYLKF